MNYYNENDPFAAAWLRELVAHDLIAQGEVDDRPIQEVRPRDLDGFTQCHFFAGIGGWPLALDLAGWPDDAPVWTGSCPCQPFSTASRGRRRGFSDPRHLWPCWAELITQCRPPTVFGEQVASAAEWYRRARSDLCAAGYSVAGAGLCASLVGLPPRPRIFFIADANGESKRHSTFDEEVAGLRQASPLAEVDWRELRGMDQAGDGVPPTMGRRRAYGNAIVPQVAAEFIRAYKEIR